MILTIFSRILRIWEACAYEVFTCTSSLGEADAEQAEHVTVGGLDIHPRLNEGVPLLDNRANLVARQVHPVEVGQDLVALHKAAAAAAKKQACATGIGKTTWERNGKVRWLYHHLYFLADEFDFAVRVILVVFQVSKANFHNTVLKTIGGEFCKKAL